ncbi:MAG: SDR family oxidoreductase [Rhodobacteraceae bacterium]|nr:SDR family oxidoreductase [Paracoccaceae bacterium]
MQVLITGGNGFIGQKLAQALGLAGALDGRKITGMTLADISEPQPVGANFPVQYLTADISSTGDITQVFNPTPDVIFHLAAVVSGAAEADFDLGMTVNLQGTMNILAAARAQANQPKVIMASSVAVHGGEAPILVHDGVALNPQTSYGTQKAMGELLLNDYVRKGFVTGCGLRLPTVSIRPGLPNAAASSFMSSIFRDTMQGNPANCPVGRDFLIWHTAPRTVVANLIYAVGIAPKAWGSNCCINLPGRTDSVDQMIDAMTRISGADAAKRITWNTDPVIEKIVNGWRNQFDPQKGLGLGFTADRSFEDSVTWFLADDIAR